MLLMSLGPSIDPVSKGALTFISSLLLSLLGLPHPLSVEDNESPLLNKDENGLPGPFEFTRGSLGPFAVLFIILSSL